MKRMMGREVFYGWWIVIASFAASLVGIGAAYYTFSVFIKPLAAEFHWSRAAISLAFSITLITYGLSGPIIGRLIDKKGAKKVMVIGSAFLGLSVIFLAFINSLWQLYILYFFIGIGICTIGLIVASVLISRWFEARRGLALGISLAGIGLGGMVMVPLAEFFISVFNWRGAYLLLGILIIAFVPLILAALLKERPEELGLLPDGGSLNPGSSKTDKGWIHGQKGFSPKESLKTPTFWLLALAGFFFTLAYAAIVSHLAPILTDAKATPKFAAAMLGLTIGISAIGRIAFGILADKFNKKYVLMSCLLLQGGGVLFLMKPEYSGLILIFAIIFGVAYGGVLSSTPLVLGEFFGIKSLGEIFGYHSLISTIGAFFGPLVAGAIYDLYGDYSLAFIISLFSCFMAGGLVFLARRPIRYVR